MTKVIKQLKIKRYKNPYSFCGLPEPVKKIILERYAKACTKTIISALRRFVDPKGKTVYELRDLLDQAYIRIDWKETIELAIQCEKENKPLPDNVMQLIVDYLHYNRLVLDLWQLIDWLEGSDLYEYADSQLIFPEKELPFSPGLK